MPEFTTDAINGPLHFEAHIAAGGDSEVIIVTQGTTSEKRMQKIQKQTVLLKDIHHKFP